MDFEANFLSKLSEVNESVPFYMYTVDSTLFIVLATLQYSLLKSLSCDICIIITQYVH